MKKHVQFREGSNYFRDGEEVFSDGYLRNSRRFRTLVAEGPFEIGDFSIRLRQRDAFSSGRYNWPQGHIAHLERSAEA